jgi:hypothetical protein
MEIPFLVFLKLNLMSDLIKSVKLDFTTLDFYNSYVVSTIIEGAVFRKSEFLQIVEVCKDNFKDNKFVYISKRDNNYNVDPTVYIQLEKFRKNLAGIAIVSNRVSSINMAEFEKNFSKAAFNIFLELKDAEEWAENLIKK